MTHVKQPDIVERLRKLIKAAEPSFPDTEAGVTVKFARQIADEIERLRDELETWRDRYHAEHQDHEATMKAWDEERSGL
jgi:hypothetical protein